MNVFLHGALTAASVTIGLFFLRFWRDTGDRLFVLFALAFWLLALSWLGLEVLNRSEGSTSVYILRLAAFLLIILAIAEKNRATVRGRQ